MQKTKNTFSLTSEETLDFFMKSEQILQIMDDLYGLYFIIMI